MNTMDQQTGLLDEITRLKDKVQKATLPDELRAKVDQFLVRLERMTALSTYTEEYEKTAHYID